MNNITQYDLKVLDIPWNDEEAYEGTVRLMTNTQQVIDCYFLAYTFKLGEIVSNLEFEYLDCMGDYKPFSANPEHQKLITKLYGEWNYLIQGQIVGLREDDALVDCGGVIIPYTDFTRDPQCIGEWIGFGVERLEVSRLF